MVDVVVHAVLLGELFYALAQVERVQRLEERLLVHLSRDLLTEVHVVRVGQHGHGLEELGRDSIQLKNITKTKAKNYKKKSRNLKKPVVYTCLLFKLRIFVMFLKCIELHPLFRSALGAAEAAEAEEALLVSAELWFWDLPPLSSPSTTLRLNEGQITTCLANEVSLHMY